MFKNIIDAERDDKFKQIQIRLINMRIYKNYFKLSEPEKETQKEKQKEDQSVHIIYMMNRETEKMLELKVERIVRDAVEKITRENRPNPYSKESGTHPPINTSRGPQPMQPNIMSQYQYQPGILIPKSERNSNSNINPDYSFGPVVPPLLTRKTPSVFPPTPTSAPSSPLNIFPTEESITPMEKALLANVNHIYTE
jgi:hypothetical protein